ncbi:putative vacuolar protein sorting-associated protein Ist1 [Helianthus annuus]|nr:putative vacuolar protein sorting-associated protein Ist1 [Helianthus annuus]KAJ0637994.1 putative vacuolar protein sorting-associated protein Ist1 [Helianthus annuus]KAJ0815181.1 putative vacuolar protein sorting-associated protein Ist1 [Helianthus annuus]
MGRKLDALLGRKFKTSKFKATVNLAVSRVTVLKNQRQARLAVARSDIIQLLNLDHHENALLRVDQVIKEQNMLDVLVMVDGYCHVVLQMVNLIEKEKDCPDELKEAVSSLLYAAPRCGEFPELQEVREILTSRYGKEFARGAIELRSNCGVNTRMIQKLSPRQSSLETRMKVLQEIAAENGIVLKFEDSSPVVKEVEEQSTQSVLDDEVVEALSFSESRKGKKKYRDVEDAAQAAFESAAYAAAAARAAVELSRSQSFGSDNPDSPNSRPRKVLGSNNGKSKLWMENENTHESESEPEQESEIKTPKNDSDPLVKSMVFDESDNEIENEQRDYSSTKQDEFKSGNTESGFEDELKIQQLDLTKRPISVRTRRVYGR